MSDEYARMERAIRYLQSNLAERPGLEAAARQAGMSPYHFQRSFRRWVGISPKRYLGALTVERAKVLLRESVSVLEPSHAVGLTGPSRLHELFVSIEASSPGEFKTEWRDLPIDYGFVMGPFGEMLIAQTPRGVCLLSFVNAQTRQRELARMHSLFRLANLREDTARAAAAADAIFRRPYPSDANIHLAVRGTNFQVNVWRALLSIPEGSITSYRALADHLGMPRAARAVANAIAANPINYLIPCHRVIRADGSVGGYRGGAELKGAVLAWESSGRGEAPAIDGAQE